MPIRSVCLPACSASSRCPMRWRSWVGASSAVHSRVCRVAARGARKKRKRFLRKGVVGDWRTTIPEPINALILNRLGWTFGHFGWTR